MNRCLALAGELADRGHAVLFATQEEGRHGLGDRGIEHVPWEPREGLVAHLRAVRNAAAKSEWFRGHALITGDHADLYPTVFASLARLLPAVAPDFLIVPQVLTPAIDLALHVGLPAAVVASYVPPELRLHPIEATPRRSRLASPWGRLRLARAGARLARARRACSPCRPAAETLRATPVIAMSDPSLEAGTTFTPNVHMVGPFMPRPLPALPPSTRRWMEAQPAGVVLAAFGTLVTLPERRLAALAEGLARAGASVLWSLPASQHALAEGASPGFRAESFVPQTTILSSPSVRAFVSHAGANSALEAMYWGRPILALPFMLDQHYYAGRVVDLSIGLALDHRTFTSADVQRAAGRLLHEPGFAEAAGRLSTRLRATPGLAGAADLVEAALEQRR